MKICRNRAEQNFKSKNNLKPAPGNWPAPLSVQPVQNDVVSVLTRGQGEPGWQQSNIQGETDETA